jgi:hypothetical protein
MTVTYYVALPFIRTEDGTAPGEAQECQSEAAAMEVLHTIGWPGYVLYATTRSLRLASILSTSAAGRA